MSNQTLQITEKINSKTSWSIWIITHIRWRQCCEKTIRALNRKCYAQCARQVYSPWVFYLNTHVTSWIHGE